MSFELDSDNQSTSSSYDNESVTISSEELGTLVFAGHGGSSAVSAIDGTAAGDVFDTFDTKVGVGGGAPRTSLLTRADFFYFVIEHSRKNVIHIAEGPFKRPPEWHQHVPKSGLKDLWARLGSSGTKSSIF